MTELNWTLMLDNRILHKNASVIRSKLCLVFSNACHDDVIKWKHFPRYWPFVRGIHRWPVNCPHKGQWRGAFMFSLICSWINGWVNNCEAGDLNYHRAHYDVTVMCTNFSISVVNYTECMEHYLPTNICRWNTINKSIGFLQVMQSAIMCK